MKHWKYLISLIFMCLTLSAYADDDSNDDDQGVDRQKVYHIYEDVDLTPTVKIAYDKPRIVVRATYPLLSSDSSNENIDAFNELVDRLMTEEMANFKNQVMDKRSLQQNAPKSGTKNELAIDFDTSIVNTTDKPIVSIRFSIQGFIASQPRPYHYHRVINFDLVNGEKMELPDLFRPDSNYLELLAAYSRTVLDKKLRDKTMILYGTTPALENYKNWNLNPNGLLMTFDEVAPSIYGTQTVLIPYSTLTKFILPGSVMSNCLKHRRRCLQNNLLTGGFMDEA